jgi:hypothetical protein
MNFATIVIAVMVIVPVVLLAADLVRSHGAREVPVEEPADDLALAPERESGVDRPDQVAARPTEQVGERRRIGEGEMRRAGQLEHRVWPAQARREPRDTRLMA